LILRTFFHALSRPCSFPGSSSPLDPQAVARRPHYPRVYTIGCRRTTGYLYYIGDRCSITRANYGELAVPTRVVKGEREIRNQKVEIRKETGLGFAFYFLPSAFFPSPLVQTAAVPTASCPVPTRTVHPLASLLKSMNDDCWRAGAERSPG
jgi:hypothetical protein